MYVLIEMADIELISVRLFKNKANANKIFDKCTSENQITEWEVLESRKELDNTIRIAGDEVYSVQLLEITPED